jgi:hypothetical protein
VKRFIHKLWWVGLWLLAGCAGADTTLPTVAVPAATVESRPATVAVPPAVLPPTHTPAATTAAEVATLEAIDPVLAEIDAEVCREAIETRAEIEVLLQQGQEVADLAAAVDELITEIEGCAVLLTPTP